MYYPSISRTAESPNATVAEARRSLHGVAIEEARYLIRYPDVRQAVASGRLASAASHYRQAGYFAARLPAEPLVDPRYYLRRYPDLARAHAQGLLPDPAVHFINFGYREARRPARGGFGVEKANGSGPQPRALEPVASRS